MQDLTQQFGVAVLQCPGEHKSRPLWRRQIGRGGCRGRTLDIGLRWSYQKSSGSRAKYQRACPDPNAKKCRRVSLEPHGRAPVENCLGSQNGRPGYVTSSEVQWEADRNRGSNSSQVRPARWRIRRDASHFVP